MTTPDTQAPERIFAWGYPDDHIAHGYEGHWHVDKGANGGTEFIRADLADARAAAAWQGGIDALLDRVGDLPISEIAADEVIYAAKQLTPPADASTALDRLIAERVREARMAALGEAAVITMGIERHMLTDDCGVMVPDRFDEGTSAAYEAIMGLVTHLEAARGSKEGRDG